MMKINKSKHLLKSMPMKRRNFIKIAAAGGAVLQFPEVLSMYEKLGKNAIPRRSLGKTGEKLSIVGFGGIALRNNGQEFANELIPRAFNSGINYFDVAPGYGDAQELMGPPLKPYRKKVFLACKTGKRDREGAEEELHESLRLLKTDHFDLYQLHAMSKMEDVDKVLGPGGAMETFIRAKQDGKVRYLGFSAHNEEVALALIKNFDFDSILYPINCVCWNNGNFGPQVFKAAREKDMGVLALKAVAKTRVARDERPYPNMWYEPFGTDEEVNRGLQFTLSKDLTATVHAGDSLFMKKTLDFIVANKKIDTPDPESIRQMIDGVEPIFRHPAT
jgi:predicted aldo/keto reductase-like oxidoreductase